MVFNFLLTRDRVLLLDENVSNFDYFISSEDLSSLIGDKELQKDFLDGLGREQVIVRPIGALKDGVYDMHGVEVLKAGEKKW